MANIKSGACFCRNHSKWVVSLIFLQWYPEVAGGAPESLSRLYLSRPSDAWIYKHVRGTVVKEMDFAFQQYPHRSVAR